MSEKALLCGQNVAALVGQESPFVKVLFVGYDDGPTSGAAQCPTRTECYRFELLARDIDGKREPEGWDRGEEIRIFSLASLPMSSFYRLEAVLSDPSSRDKMAHDQAFYDNVNAILVDASPPQLVIATHGIRTSIIAARRLNPEEIGNVEDWFTFLGIDNADR